MTEFDGLAVNGDRMGSGSDRGGMKGEFCYIHRSFHLRNAIDPDSPRQFGTRVGGLLREDF